MSHFTKSVQFFDKKTFSLRMFELHKRLIKEFFVSYLDITPTTRPWQQ